MSSPAPDGGSSRRRGSPDSRWGCRRWYDLTRRFRCTERAADDRGRKSIMSRSRLFAGIAGILATILLAWVGWLLIGGGQVREGVAWSRQRMAEGQFAEARDRLARLSAWWPHDDEVAYLLGECEAKLGRPDAAVDAWRTIRAESALKDVARLEDGRLLVRPLGRLGEAESAFRMAARGGGARGDAGPMGDGRAAALGRAARRAAPAAPGDLAARGARRSDRRAPRALAARLGDRRGRGGRTGAPPGRSDGVRRSRCRAGPRAPGRAIRPLRRGARLARRLLRIQPGVRCRHPAPRPPPMGPGRRRARRGAASPGRDPGRSLRRGRALVAPRLVRRAARRRRGRARCARARRRDRARPDPGARSPGRAGRAGRPGRSRRGDPPPSGGGPARQGTLPPTDDRRSRPDPPRRAARAGPAGRSPGPPVRSRRVADAGPPPRPRRPRGPPDPRSAGARGSSRPIPRPRRPSARRST